MCVYHCKREENRKIISVKKVEVRVRVYHWMSGWKIQRKRQHCTCECVYIVACLGGRSSKRERTVTLTWRAGRAVCRCGWTRRRWGRPASCARACSRSWSCWWCTRARSRRMLMPSTSGSARCWRRGFPSGGRFWSRRWVRRTDDWHPLCCHSSSGGRGNSSAARARDSWLKGPGFESMQEWQEKFLLQGQLSVLLFVFWYPFHPRVTAVAHKTPRSFRQKCRCRLQLNTYARHGCGFCMKLYGVHRAHWDGSSFIWRQPCQH